MTNYSKGSKVVVASALILSVLLFFAPKKPWSSGEEKTHTPGKIESKVELQPAQQKILDSLVSALGKAGDNAAKEKALNGMAALWKELKKPLQVAQTYEQLAE